MISGLSISGLAGLISFGLAFETMPEDHFQTLADAARQSSGASAAGVAYVDLEGNRGLAVSGTRIRGGEAAVTSEDLWHIGSNTKAMTATLAARLVEAGRLRWDIPLEEALSDTDIVLHPDYATVTLEDLLTHRSGLMANLGPFQTISFLGADEDRDVQADRLSYARIVLEQAPAHSKGSFVYSNAGYVVAGMVMEHLAGASYEDLMRDEVFAPLGMQSADWGAPGVVDAEDQPRGHRQGMFGRWIVQEPTQRADNPPVMNSAGRAHMTLDDVLDFLQAHLRAENGPYLSADSWSRLQAPVGAERYGLGWGVSDEGVLRHAGSNTMWLIQARIDRSEGWAGAAVVNHANMETAAPATAAALEGMED